MLTCFSVLECNSRSGAPEVKELAKAGPTKSFWQKRQQRPPKFGAATTTCRHANACFGSLQFLAAHCARVGCVILEFGDDEKDLRDTNVDVLCRELQDAVRADGG